MAKYIYIMGDIDNEAFAKFTIELAELENSKHLPKEIVVSLMSDGGSAYAALAFFDRITQSELHHNITVVATGLVASAATLILASGSKRCMTKNSWLMVHEDSAPNTKSLSVTAAENEMKHSRAMEIQWNKLLAKVTNCTAEGWDKLNKEVSYLSPEECLFLGLIEEIV